MIQVIVFSFNRALQLDTLLCTMLEHWKQPSFELDVVYNTSSLDFQNGYDMLIEKMSNNPFIHFHKEEQPADKVGIRDILNIHNIKRFYERKCLRHPRTNFRSLTINLMEQSSAKHIMFMTDDAMFIDDVNLNEDILTWILSEPEQNQYALRVGFGMDDKNAHYNECADYLAWEFDKQDSSTNWGYCFSVDAHIYAKSTILELFKRNLFVNPNTLEGPIYGDAFRHGLLNQGRGPKYTKILSFPINMVQTVDKNETLGVSTEKMNQYYLDGYTMRYPLPEKPNHFQQYPESLLFYKDGEKKAIKMV